MFTKKYIIIIFSLLVIISIVGFVSAHTFNNHDNFDKNIVPHHHNSYKEKIDITTNQYENITYNNNLFQNKIIEISGA